ncbi:MAG: hypothetical protein AAF757_16165 [Cyanobacteria bacterium P01_D01_bin.116]
MKFNQIVVIATIVCLVVAISNTKAIPAANTINLIHSTKTLDNYNTFIQSKKQTKKQISQTSDSDLMNSKYKIKRPSMTDNWINLLGSLIILESFTSLGTKSNSVVIERYIKFIFKDVLPIFIIVYSLLILFGIASLIAANYFSYSIPLTVSSVSYQNNCILK